VRCSWTGHVSGSDLWLISPNSVNTSLQLQLVLRPHFLVRFVWYDLLAIWFGPENKAVVGLSPSFLDRG
jgi:hypothetical protein